MNRKTLFLIFILVATVAILTYVAVLQSIQGTRKEQISTQAPGADGPTIDPSFAADTTLTASPSAGLLSVNDIQTVDILIDTGNNTITTAQIEISYDPKFVNIEKLDAGTFFEQPTILLNDINNESGRIQLALGTITPKKGQGILATLTIRAIAPTKEPPLGGPAELLFSPKTQVLGESNLNLNSLIKEMTGTSFIIKTQ